MALTLTIGHRTRPGSGERANGDAVWVRRLGEIRTSRGGRLWGGDVGNVEARVPGTAVSALLTPGLLGHRLRRLRTFDAELRERDRVLQWSGKA